MIYLDLETRSFADISKTGTYVYANHATTQASCAAYLFDDDMLMRTWAPWRTLNDEFRAGSFANNTENLFRSTRDLKPLFDCPPELRKRIEAGEPIASHNAFFERCMFELHLVPYHNWPLPKPEQWVCTMAAAHYSGLPGKLKDLAKFLDVGQQIGAKKSIRKLMKPRPTWVEKGTGDPWFGTADEYEQLVGECCDDVRAEYECYQKCFELPPREQKIWAVDQEINMRGVPIDRELAAAAVSIIDAENVKAVASLSMLTGGAVTTPKQRDRILNWLKTQDVEAPNLQAPTVAALLAGDLTSEVRRVLEIRQALGGAATNKYKAFLEHCSLDGQVRGELIYCGAHTGRWTSKGVQLHNASKNKMDVDDAEALIRFVLDGTIQRYLPESTSLDDALSTLVRSVVRAGEDDFLIALDYSAIEARGLAWLVGEDELLNLFRRGVDPYVLIAAKVYNIELELVTKAQRALGKVIILALGYGMGLNKFRATVVSWGLTVADDVIETAFRLYRNTYLETVNFWFTFDRLLHSVIKTGKAQGWKRLIVSYDLKTELLTVHLPNGRPLSYPHATSITKVVKVKGKKDWVKNAIHYWGKKDGHPAWVDQWGGGFTENVVQALCRDLMAGAMVRMRDEGIQVILTVHDEILVQAKCAQAGAVKARMAEIMTAAPVWALGFPIAVEGYIAERYRKD